MHSVLCCAQPPTPAAGEAVCGALGALLTEWKFDGGETTVAAQPHIPLYPTISRYIPPYPAISCTGYHEKNRPDQGFVRAPSLAGQTARTHALGHPSPSLPNRRARFRDCRPVRILWFRLTSGARICMCALFRGYRNPNRMSDTDSITIEHRNAMRRRELHLRSARGRSDPKLAGRRV